MIIVGLSVAELLLIHPLSRRLSRPIESISRDLKSVENLSFDQPVTRPSKVREIAQLQSAAWLLRNSLQSFCSFVPVDVVRGLIKSGIPLALGVERRSLTILFADLENFSTHAEQSTPDALLDQMSLYFEQVSRAISDEEGTVDKFIGDGIMAFWGAPVALSEHVLHGLRGSLAGCTANGAGQGGMACGRQTDSANPDRPQQRRGVGWQHRIFGTIQLYGHRGRCERGGAARGNEQDVRHHDLHQR
jgi:adenylate cyclase